MGYGGNNGGGCRGGNGGNRGGYGGNRGGGQQYDDEMRGTLFINQDKDPKNQEHEKWPDRTGKIQINGVKYKLSGWIKYPKNGGDPFLSLSVQVDEGPKGGGRGNGNQNNQQGGNQQSGQQGNGGNNASNNQQGDNPRGDVPF